jgi:hypothetical protein
VRGEEWCHWCAWEGGPACVIGGPTCDMSRALTPSLVAKVSGDGVVEGAGDACGVRGVSKCAWVPLEDSARVSSPPPPPSPHAAVNVTTS